MAQSSAYTFTITLPLNVNGKATHFKVNADPQFDPTTAAHFFTDDTAEIRYNEGAPADGTSPSIPR